MEQNQFYPLLSSDQQLQFGNALKAASEDQKIEMLASALAQNVLTDFHPANRTTISQLSPERLRIKIKASAMAICALGDDIRRDSLRLIGSTIGQVKDRQKNLYKTAIQKICDSEISYSTDDGSRNIKIKRALERIIDVCPDRLCSIDNEVVENFKERAVGGALFELAKVNNGKGIGDLTKALSSQPELKIQVLGRAFYDSAQANDCRTFECLIENCREEVILKKEALAYALLRLQKNKKSSGVGFFKEFCPEELKSEVYSTSLLQSAEIFPYYPERAITERLAKDIQDGSKGFFLGNALYKANKGDQIMAAWGIIRSCPKNFQEEMYGMAFALSIDDPEHGETIISRLMNQCPEKSQIKSFAYGISHLISCDKFNKLKALANLEFPPGFNTSLLARAMSNCALDNNIDSWNKMTASWSGDSTFQDIINAGKMYGLALRKCSQKGNREVMNEIIKSCPPNQKNVMFAQALLACLLKGENKGKASIIRLIPVGAGTGILELAKKEVCANPENYKGLSFDVLEKRLVLLKLKSSHLLQNREVSQTGIEVSASSDVEGQKPILTSEMLAKMEVENAEEPLQNMTEPVNLKQQRKQQRLERLERIKALRKKAESRRRRKTPSGFTPSPGKLS